MASISSNVICLSTFSTVIWEEALGILEFLTVMMAKDPTATRNKAAVTTIFFGQLKFDVFTSS